MYVSDILWAEEALVRAEFGAKPGVVERVA